MSEADQINVAMTICPMFAPEIGDSEAARMRLLVLPIDPHRIYLMGYSNGAMAVTRAAILAPELFQGLIYISPVTEDQLFATKEFLSRARDRKTLFLHGGRDGQIRRSIVEATVASLKHRVSDVHITIYDDEGHWLLFSQPKSVLDDVFTVHDGEVIPAQNSLFASHHNSSTTPASTSGVRTKTASGQ
jgi:pimeloyl-ACP methyl ester carboxylesterase